MKTDNAAIQYASFILHILTCVIGVLGNAAVIYIYGFIMKKNKSKIWFLNLAVADLVFVLCLPLNAVTIFMNDWPFGCHMCKLYNFLSICNMYVSIFTITALTIDRVLSVAKPIWHCKFFSQRYCYYICAFIWVLTVLASLPALIFSVEYKTAEQTECRLFDIGHINNEANEDLGLRIFSHVDDYNNFNETWVSDMNQTELNSSQSLSSIEGPNHFYSEIWLPETNLTEPGINQTSWELHGNNTEFLDMNGTLKYRFAIAHNLPLQHFDISNFTNLIDLWNRMVYITECIVLPLLIIGYIIPFCTIIFSNVIIVLRARKSQTEQPSRLYQIIVTVVVVYFLTWTPLVVSELMLLACARSKNFELIKKVYNVLPLLYSIAYTNSCLNPIIYVFVGKQVRRELTELVSTIRQKYSRSSHSTSGSK